MSRKLSYSACLVAGLVACSVISGCSSDGGWVISEDEISAEADVSPNGQGRSVSRSVDMFKPGHPRIELVRPDSLKKLANPVNMELRFTAEDDVQIDMASFRVKYGRLGLDITDRLLKYGRLDVNRASLVNVELKPGSYDVEVVIADTRKRESRLPLHIEVAR